jgi:hypothetical protein
MADWETDGWAWFLQPSPADDEPLDEVRIAYARAFGTAAGKQVLAHLRAQTIERQLPPDASVAALRFLEGQRRLVHSIETLANLAVTEG